MQLRIGMLAAVAVTAVAACTLASTPASALTSSAHNPLLRVDSAAGSFSVLHNGYAVQLRGWTFDRDSSSRALTFIVAEGSSRRAHVTTTARRDVNAAYRIRGYHGFDLTIMTKPGHHRYCLIASNVGAGSATTLCVAVFVAPDAVPVGHLDALSMVNGLMVATGWAYDANNPEYSTDVELASTQPPPPNPGISYAAGTAGLSSPDIDAAHHITGKHRFRITLPAFSDGPHTVCATAMNLGPGYQFTGLLGCAQATVHNDPYGQAVATASSGNVHLEGYAVDPNDPSASLTVRVTLSSQHLAYPANLPSDAIDAQLDITGNHGFSIDIPAAAGDYFVIIFVDNISAGFDKMFLAQDITVPA